VKNTFLPSTTNMEDFVIRSLRRARYQHRQWNAEHGACHMITPYWRAVHLIGEFTQFLFVKSISHIKESQAEVAAPY
jgi:hypothetical protein